MRSNAAKALNQLYWKPATVEQRAYWAMARCDFEACVSEGAVTLEGRGSGPVGVSGVGGLLGVGVLLTGAGLLEPPPPQAASRLALSKALSNRPGFMMLSSGTLLFWSANLIRTNVPRLAFPRV